MLNEAIKVGEHSYRVGRKLPAMEQFHVTRRLGPALIICGVSFKMILEGKDVPLDNWLAVAGPVMQIVCQMSNEDTEYVIYTCMKTVERQQQDGSWAPVTTPDGSQLMFADMDQAELIRMTVEVLRNNLVNFAKGMGVGANISAG